MAATNNFSATPDIIDAPANHAFAITPSDSSDLSNVTRAIYVGGQGDIVLITLGNETVTFTAVPGGTVLPVRATRVKATSTTATSLVGMY